MAQCYDFESSFSSFMGAFAIFGFLPVVPGPCGLYRWSDMKGKPLEWYFEIVNKKNEDCGLVLANLKIAEDRILSYSSVLKTERETKMSIEPDAEFYFEAETDLELFAKQRRRWINGTFAGYVYMIQNKGLIWNSKMNRFRQLAVMFLLICQLGIYSIVTITPAIFLCAMFSVLSWIFPGDGLDGLIQPSIPAFIFWLFYVAFFLWFMLAHLKREKDDNAFVGWMFYVQMFISMLTIGATFVGSIVFLRTKWGPWSTTYLEGIPVLIAFSVMITPLFISLHRIQSWWRAVKSFVPFYFFLPTLVAWFGCYSVARFADISTIDIFLDFTVSLAWGNRPAGGEAKTAEVESQKSMKEKERQRKLQSKFQSQARTYFVAVLLVNLTFLLFYIQKNNSQLFMLVIAILVCCFSVVQMCLSFVFFLLNFLLEKVVFFLVTKLITFISSKVYVQINTYTAISNANVSPPSRILLTFIQLSIHFCYQSIFQGVPIILNYYNSNVSDTEYALQTIGYPLCGIVFVIVGIMGDKKLLKEPTTQFFKVMTVIGFISFTVTTALFEIVRRTDYYATNEEQYWMALTQSYCQVFSLNIVEAGSFVVFLQYAKPHPLDYVIARSIMGSIGNLIPSLINLSTLIIGDFIQLQTILNSIGCVLIGVGTALLGIATRDDPNDLAPEDKIEDPDNRDRRIAIVLVTFFYFEVALSPIQFGLFSYFEQFNLNDTVTSQITNGAFCAQYFIIIVIGNKRICKESHISRLVDYVYSRKISNQRYCSCACSHFLGPIALPYTCNCKQYLWRFHHRCTLWIL